MILPFASLLDAVRQRQSLSVEALASAAEVSPAVVGEILGGRTHANMGVAVRLCQALGLRCADAFHTLSGYPMEPSPIGDVLSYADVRQFDELYDRRRPAAVDLLRDLLLAPLAHGRGAALDPALITELALREDDVVRLHLAYPIALRQAEIRDIALRGGVILAEDVASYAQRTTIPGTSTELLRRVRTVLQRLASSPLEEARLSSVMEMDIYTQQRGVFFAMAWSLWAAPPAHIRLFVLACRWHAWHDQGGANPHGWLIRVREMLGEADAARADLRRFLGDGA